jgi:uncharacterized repeat protein (TIGR03803 family)
LPNRPTLANATVQPPVIWGTSANIGLVEDGSIALDLEIMASLIADRAGNLYGTTIDGGAAGSGVVSKLSGTGFVP